MRNVIIGTNQRSGQPADWLLRWLVAKIHTSMSAVLGPLHGPFSHDIFAFFHDNCVDDLYQKQLRRMEVGRWFQQQEETIENSSNNKQRGRMATFPSLARGGFFRLNELDVSGIAWLARSRT
jgi:hypothetical protein